MATKIHATDISADEAAILEARSKAVGVVSSGNAVSGFSADTHEFTLPDGRSVFMGPPSGGITRKIAVMLSDDVGHIGLMMMWLKAMMHVRSIGGTAFPSVNSVIDAQRVADSLGAQGEEIVISAYQDLWPSVSFKDLQTVKK